MYENNQATPERHAFEGNIIEFLNKHVFLPGAFIISFGDNLQFDTLEVISFH